MHLDGILLREDFSYYTLVRVSTHGIVGKIRHVNFVMNEATVFTIRDNQESTYGLLDVIPNCIPALYFERIPQRGPTRSDERKDIHCYRNTWIHECMNFSLLTVSCRFWNDLDLGQILFCTLPGKPWFDRPSFVTVGRHCEYYGQRTNESTLPHSTEHVLPVSADWALLQSMKICISCQVFLNY